MARTASVLIVLLVAAPAHPQAFYRWVDAAGTTHYTDNAASIPKGATVFATEGEPISELGKPGPAPAPTAKVEPQPVGLDPAVPSSSEQFWRGQFRAAREKIRSLEDEISADRHRVEDANGLPVGLSYSCAPSWSGYVPPVRYGSSIVIGPQGAQAYFGPVPQPSYVHPGFGLCIQTINPEYDRVRDRLEKNRSALQRAKDELHELERQASFEAVPLEWRR